MLKSKQPIDGASRLLARSHQIAKGRRILALCGVVVAFDTGLAVIIFLTVFLAGCATKSEDQNSDDPADGPDITMSTDDVAPDGDISIERYPWLKAPAVVQRGVTFPVQVSLDRAPNGLSPAARFALPDREKWDLLVILDAGDFEIIEGGPLRTIEMKQNSSSNTAVFELRAPIELAQSASLGPLPISATFLYENRFLARVTTSVEIGDEEPATTATTGTAQRVTLDLKRDEADLTMIITESQLVLIAPQLGGPPVYAAIEAMSLNDRASLVQVYDELAAAANVRNLGDSQLSSDGSAVQTGKAVAVSAGRRLWEQVAPPAFKEVFWDLVDALGPDFDSMQIYATDPVIPWELMRPYKEGLPERDFLGLEFDVARGHAPQSDSAFAQMPEAVVIDEFLILRPEYVTPLPGTAEEVLAIQSLPRFRPDILLSTFDELSRISQALPNGIIHFAGHAIVLQTSASEVRYALVLSDRSVSLSEWMGLLPEPHLRTHPFIFFNACSVGRTYQAFGFAQGWAPAFLKVGASGYVGTLWPVADRAAARFAARFYHVLDQEFERSDGVAHPARAMRETRRLFAEDPDPTYLAYVLYGETDLVLSAP